MLLLMTMLLMTMLLTTSVLSILLCSIIIYIQGQEILNGEPGLISQLARSKACFSVIPLFTLTSHAWYLPNISPPPTNIKFKQPLKLYTS